MHQAGLCQSINNLGRPSKLCCRDDLDHQRLLIRVAVERGREVGRLGDFPESGGGQVVSSVGSFAEVSGLNPATSYHFH